MHNFRVRCRGLALAATFPAMSIPGASLAQQHPTASEPQSAYERCFSTGDAARGVMPAIFDCQHAELDRVDEELNRAYRQLRQDLPAARFQKLRIAQREWIKRRDSRCLADTGAASGAQDSQMEWLSCLILATSLRAYDLEQMLPRTR